MAGLDLLKIYQSFQNGREEARRNRLFEMDELGRNLQGQVLAGDKSKLNQLMQVDAQRGMQTQTYMNDRQKAETAEFLQAAFSADTPTKWQAVVDRFRAKGHVFDEGEDSWDNRENLLSEGQTIAEQQNIKWRQQEAARDQGNTDRAYDLQRLSFDADQQWRQTQADLEQRKLNAAAPDIVEMYDGPTGQPYKARWDPKSKTFDRVGGIKAPAGGNQLSVTLPDGTVINQGTGKLTELDSKGATYATRAAGALPLVDQYGDALLSFGENVAGRAPLIGNFMKSPDYQRAQQASDEFLQAILRKDTGAAITKEEKGEYGLVYIPQPGDSPQVLQQKKVSRTRAYEALRAGMSPSAILAQEQALLRANGMADQQGGAKNDAQSQAGKTRRGITFQVGE
jgi:alkylated DNA nucleotide flippase Atl1